ncbi:Erythronate-4-phosphate dehydrogenase [bioreactor metagenome]|uniref:Erythronate-4-phosphate dehydrogenase n=1 Tax=bioreactor metagenome TaxID=1076179 RepID=A0A645DTN3_9ZZZZ
MLLDDPPRQAREAWREGEEAEKTVFVDLETIKKEANIITLHTPLTKTGRHKTYHLADEHFFDTLDKKPFIINSCRGSVADNVAMKKALKAGKISGVVIDCWENEPDIDQELLQMADIATPHIAGYSADGKWTATKMSLENLNEFFGLGIHPIKLMPLPQPENRVIDLKEIAPNNQLAYAVWQTYNPMEETANLKANPGKFYQFRSNYPLRREYYAYELKNTDSCITPVLRELGFNV